MVNSSDWTPNRDEAIKALIRDTISASGSVPPDQLPHHIRQRLKGQIEGVTDMDAVIAEIIAEEARKSR